MGAVVPTALAGVPCGWPGTAQEDKGASVSLISAEEGQGLQKLRPTTVSTGADQDRIGAAGRRRAQSRPEVRRGESQSPEATLKN